MTALLTLFILAASTAPQEREFELSGAIKYKNFITKDQRALIADDYREYDDYASMELGMKLDLWAPLPCGLDYLQVAAYPYFWITPQRGLGHIGLEIDSAYPILEDLQFGYHHHSWHNADDNTPNNRGRTQDALFLSWNFADWRWNSDSEKKTSLSLSLRPQVYVHNTQPLEIKDLYERSDPAARYDLGLIADWSCDKWRIGASPNIQLDDRLENTLYGFKGQISYGIFKNLELFADFKALIGEEDHFTVAAIGFMVKFN